MEEILEKLQACVLDHMEDTSVSTDEMGKVIDMVKDTAMAMYYVETAKAMREYPEKFAPSMVR